MQKLGYTDSIVEKCHVVAMKHTTDLITKNHLDKGIQELTR